MKRILASILAGLVFSSCAPSTPQTRIAKNPEQFAALSKKEQSLVEQGQIRRGMSSEAVMLAWGPPDQSFEGSRDSKPSERWDYFDARPIYSSNYYGGFGYGFGGYGPYGYPAYSGVGFAVGPDVAYVPYREASVWFVNHRVDSWERLR
jgi:hypothetical protein